MKFEGGDCSGIRRALSGSGTPLCGKRLVARRGRNVPRYELVGRSY